MSFLSAGSLDTDVLIGSCIFDSTDSRDTNYTFIFQGLKMTRKQSKEKDRYNMHDHLANLWAL